MEDREVMLEFFRNSRYPFYSKIAMFLTSFVFSIILIRIIPVELYGVFTLYMLVATLVQVFSMSGFSNSIIFFLSSSGRKGQAMGTLIVAYLAVMLLTNFAIGSALGFILKFLKIETFWFAVPFVFFMFNINSINSFLNCVFQTFKMKNTFKITVVSSAFSFLPVVFYIIDPSLLSILLSQVVTAVFVLIFSLAFVKREWFGRISYSHKIFKKIISYSGILYFAGVFWIAGSKSFSFFLNYFSGIVQVSFFSVAFGLYTIMTYLQDSLSTGMFPIISRLGKNNKMSIINSFSRVYAMIYAPIIVAFLFYSDFLIPLIFSVRYAGAVPVFQVLCITNLVVIFSIVLTPLSYACGREKFGFYSNLLALAVSVFSSFMLVPRFNAVGAAYSFLTTMAAMISLWWVLFLREFKDVKFPFSAVRIIIVSLGVGFLAYFATSSVHLLFPFIFIPLCYWFLRITKACDDKDLELLLKGLKIFLNLR